jgi:hypothetical protein
VNAKEFADFARRTALPNMKSWGGNLNLWLSVPATVAEWEAKSIRFHEEQARRAAADSEVDRVSQDSPVVQLVRT